MPEKETRDWSPKYRKQVTHGEKFFAAILLIIPGITLLLLADGLGEYVGAGMAAAGGYAAFPVLRPMVQFVVERIPWLADKDAQ